MMQQVPCASEIAPSNAHADPPALQPTSGAKELDTIHQDLASAKELCDQVRTTTAATAAQDIASKLAEELASCPELLGAFVEVQGHQHASTPLTYAYEMQSQPAAKRRFLAAPPQQEFAWPAWQVV